MAAENTLSYYNKAAITAVKSFIEQVPGYISMKVRLHARRLSHRRAGDIGYQVQYYKAIIM
jgi:hypothetical protein